MGSGVNNARRPSNSVAFAYLVETLSIPRDYDDFCGKSCATLVYMNQYAEMLSFKLSYQ